MKQKGIAGIFIILIVFGVLLLGGFAYYVAKPHSPLPYVTSPAPANTGATSSSGVTANATDTQSDDGKVCKNDADCAPNENCEALGPYSANPNGIMTCWPKNQPPPPQNP